MIACVSGHVVHSLYLVLLILAEGPDGPKVPAGTSSIGEALDDQVHICQALLVGRGLSHGGWSVRDPGAPVILHNVQQNASVLTSKYCNVILYHS